VLTAATGTSSAGHRWTRTSPGRTVLPVASGWAATTTGAVPADASGERTASTSAASTSRPAAARRANTTRRQPMPPATPKSWASRETTRWPGRFSASFTQPTLGGRSDQRHQVGPRLWTTGPLWTSTGRGRWGGQEALAEEVLNSDLAELDDELDDEAESPEPDEPDDASVFFSEPEPLETAEPARLSVR